MPAHRLRHMLARASKDPTEFHFLFDWRPKNGNKCGSKNFAKAKLAALAAKSVGIEVLVSGQR